jgi:hypothetical protein
VLVLKEKIMARPQNIPLRLLQVEERIALEKISHALSWPTDQLTRSKELLAVVDGKASWRRLV